MNTYLLKKFLSLPVNADESWQGGIVSMADILGAQSNADVDDVVMVLLRSSSSKLVHAQPIGIEGETRLSAFVDGLQNFSREYEFPFRPAQIECNEIELVDGLSELLGHSGTTVSLVEEMTEWNEVLQDLTEHFGSASSSIGSLTDAGCTEPQIREFAEAAAAFYRAGIWDYLNDVDLIKIETPKPSPCLKYALVLGAGSQTYGLGFYDNAEDHYDMMAQRIDVREQSLFSLTFDSPSDSPSVDVDLWNELELPLETGEALPSMNFFSDDETRRPTPQELNFATVVLKTLAATSEAEIDSGRWTKSVKCLGRVKKCVLSIPNLLDPPDQQEWMRRGMTPERRGNERHFKRVQEFIEQTGGELSLDELNDAINAKFTGPPDDIEYPLDTPANRAEAFYHQAIDTFGRQRIKLAKRALAEDPTHVDASVLLAESTRRADDRIVAFQDAKENGKTQLGATMQEAVGHFWDRTETRPFMRACQGLAEALHAAGQTNEAILQYQEMLHLNPNDNQGVRYKFIPLLLAHERDSEAIALLDDYRAETAFWHYTMSLVEFRRSGRSLKSKKAIRLAFRANEHVVPALHSTDIPKIPDSFALGSPEEAVIHILDLQEAWAETEGFTDWMSQEYAKWEGEKMKRRRDRKRKQRKKATRPKRPR
jgi:tetratricopeptide (TPR) repeat protein